MHGSPTNSALAGVLFEEDFDLPPTPKTPPEPEVIEPVITAADLEVARAEAWREGYEAAREAAEKSDMAEARFVLCRIAELMDAARLETVAMAEQSADAVARLVCGAFAAAFPALSSRHGETEVRAVVETILPSLHQEPTVTIRLNPHLATVMSRAVESLDADLATRVKVIPTDAVAYGDVRIAWRNGSAVRDTASLWPEIESILASSGFLALQPANKEAAHVE